MPLLKVPPTFPASIRQPIIGNGNVTPFPQFTKLGSKLVQPSWTAGEQIMFPRLLENSQYRSTLPSLPSSRFSVLYSTDHASGKTGRVDFDDIEGTWTDYGSSVHSPGANSRETPHPVYDAANNRVLVTMHDAAPATGVTYSIQHTVVLSTTDMTTFTLIKDVPIPYGHHTGYAQLIAPGVIDSDWHMYHITNGGECYMNARSSSSNGVDFTLQETWHPAMRHLCNDNEIFQGVPFVVEWGGQWYLISNLATLPRLATYPNNITKMVAIPIAGPKNIKPNGGYFVLLDRSVITTDPDYRLLNYVGVYKIDDVLYLLYAGRTSAGVSHLCVAKSVAGTEATAVSPRWPMNADGSLTGAVTPTTVINWDATANTLPAGMSVVTNAGTNNSNWSSGNYYELKTGSGSAQDIWLRHATAFNPLTYNSFDITIRGLTMAPTVASTGADMQFGLFNNPATNTNGIGLHFRDGAEGGQILGWSGVNSPRIIDEATYILPYNEVLTTDLPQWRRSNPVDLTIRIHSSTPRITVFIDGAVAYHRSLTGVNMTSVIPVLRLFTRSPHPQWWVRFKGFNITTY